MSEPDWNDFRVILALGRGRSLAGAARHLGVDASTVSWRLAAAEAAMGAVLIVRGGRDFTFTSEGRAALAAAAAMETAAGAAANAVRPARVEMRGLVRIARPPAALPFLLPLQQGISEVLPGLGIDLLPGRVPVDLAKGEAVTRANRVGKHGIPAEEW